MREYEHKLEKNIKRFSLSLLAINILCTFIIPLFLDLQSCFKRP